MIKHAYFIDRNPIYLKYAVLFTPQFSFTGTYEIHVLGKNFYSAIEIGLHFLYIKKVVASFK